MARQDGLKPVTLFKGVNVPSKTFGELVEHECMTPSISADELQLRLERDEPTVVLDGRRNMNILRCQFLQRAPALMRN